MRMQKLAPQGMRYALCDIAHLYLLSATQVCGVAANWIPRTITHAKLHFARDPTPRDDGNLEFVVLTPLDKCNRIFQNNLGGK